MSSFKSYNYYSTSTNKKQSTNTNTYPTSYGPSPYSNDSIRIIKRNLVYVINLDPKIADKDILTKRDYFGQYGKITKILVNLNKAYNSSNPQSGLSYSAYINYSTNQEAALAILSVDSCILNNKMIKAAFGTTKYCSYYLKKQNCPIKDCVYMHSVSDKNDIISKDSADFYVDQHRLAVKIADISNEKVKELLFKNKIEDTILPNPYTIYTKRSLVNLIKACIEEKDQSQRKLSNEKNLQKQTLRDIFGANANATANVTLNEKEEKKDEHRDNEEGNAYASNNVSRKYTSVSPNQSSDKNNENYKSKSSNTPDKKIIEEDQSFVNKEKEKLNKSEHTFDTGKDIGNTNKESESSKSPEIKPYGNNNENSCFDQKVLNKRQILFNDKTTKSRFSFGNLRSSDLQEENEQMAEYSPNDQSDERLIIQNYFLRFSFSSSFNSKDKEAFESQFYKSIHKSSTVGLTAE